MIKYFVHNNQICIDKGRELPIEVICDILNTCEQHSNIKPSDCTDFQKYKCENCDKEECGHTGSWNKEPYLFFCSKECHHSWLLKQEKNRADNNDLCFCPFCEENKMVYVGRADSHWCYGCEQWYDYDLINMEYNG